MRAWSRIATRQSLLERGQPHRPCTATVTSRRTDVAHEHPKAAVVREPARRSRCPIAPITVAASRRRRCRNWPLAASGSPALSAGPPAGNLTAGGAPAKPTTAAARPRIQLPSSKLAIDGEFSATLDSTKNIYQLVRLGVAKRVTDLT